MPVTEVELETARENLRDSEILRFKINPKTKKKDWDALVTHMNLFYDGIGWEFCPKVSRFKDKDDVQKLWVQINNDKRKAVVKVAMPPLSLLFAAAALSLPFQSTDEMPTTHASQDAMLELFSKVRISASPLV